MTLLHYDGICVTRGLGALALAISWLIVSMLPGPVASADPANPVVSAASNERAGVTDTEILLASCAAFEGPVAAVGKRVVAGGKLYLDYVNDQGGVNGRKIKLISHNDSYDPDKAIECFHWLLNENAFAGVFFVGAPPATKYVPMAEANNLPIVGLFTGAQMLHDPFRPHVISVRASYYDEATAQVNHFWDVGYRRFAVIYQYDACGVATLDGVKRALAKHGANIVSQGSFERGSLEVEEAIKQVRAGNPEVIIMDGTAPPIIKIIKQCHASKWKPLFTSVSFLPTESFIKEAGPDAEGTVITQVVPSYDQIELPTVALYRRLLKKYQPNQDPSFASLEGFVDGVVVVEGLKQAGRDLTRAKFIAAIESMHSKDIGLGPEFKLHYGPKDHKGFDSVCYTVVRGGHPVMITDWKHLALVK
jgi:branched-chain amino acid transport system substrate-binding protein